jgi:hypothetical protein
VVVELTGAARSLQRIKSGGRNVEHRLGGAEDGLRLTLDTHVHARCEGRRHEDGRTRQYRESCEEMPEHESSFREGFGSGGRQVF